MSVSLVVAMAENGVIGHDNALPWHLPDDLRYFKQVTLGKTVVMGRKTFESIGRPLPGRRNVVLTRDPSWRADGVTVVHDLDAALPPDQNPAEEIMVIGGADIFALALPHADRLYLTEVKGHPAGDTRFPAFDRSAWREVDRRPGAPDSTGRHTHDYVVLERRPLA